MSVVLLPYLDIGSIGRLLFEIDLVDQRAAWVYAPMREDVIKFHAKLEKLNCPVHLLHIRPRLMARDS